MTVLGVESLTKMNPYQRTTNFQNGPTESNVIKLNLNPTTDVSNSQDSDKFSEIRNETNIALNFSVDRLLNYEKAADRWESAPAGIIFQNECKYGNSRLSCCAYETCLFRAQYDIQRRHIQLTSHRPPSPNNLAIPIIKEIKSIIRPTPIRVRDDRFGPAYPITPPVLQYCYLDEHQGVNVSHKHGKEKVNFGSFSHITMSSLQINHTSEFNLPDSGSIKIFESNIQNVKIASAHIGSINIRQTEKDPNQQRQPCNRLTGSGEKRKRSWSRAVFSNLQRKGLEIQFQQQKYITKPDRRKLAARLNLSDAQVKVWFQNRRMKWRHTRENLKSGQEKQITTGANGGEIEKTGEKTNKSTGLNRDLEMCSNEEDIDIDVVK